MNFLVSKYTSPLTAYAYPLSSNSFTKAIILLIFPSSFFVVVTIIFSIYSILNYYKRALRLRNENPELARGTIEAVETLCDGHQAVITKTWEDSTIAVVYNTSDEAIEVNLAGSAIDSMAIRGYLTLHGEAITLENGVLTMPAQSICIMK